LAHNAIVTITCPHGTVLEASLLSQHDNEIRAAAAGCDDTLVFTRFKSTWVSEDLEPVVIQFAWQRSKPFPVTSEDNCICSKELASRLINSLMHGCDPEGSGNPDLCQSEEHRHSNRRSVYQPS
jgi:hypothetical protein